MNWLKKQNWFSIAERITIDRFGDDRAKELDPTDIQIGISNNDGRVIW